MHEILKEKLDNITYYILVLVVLAFVFFVLLLVFGLFVFSRQSLTL